MFNEGFSRTHIGTLFSVFPVLLFFGCATVPATSVDLSKKIGEEIDQSRAAHLSTLDAFYHGLQAANDKWVVDDYLPALIKRASAGMEAACTAKNDKNPGCSQLGTDEVAMLVKSTVAYRDSLQQLLEKNRDGAFQLINSHYASLSTANAGVTGILASAVDVAKATKDATNTVTRVSGVKIDLEAIQKAMDGFLVKAGTAGLKVSDLEKSLSEILEKSKKNDKRE